MTEPALQATPAMPAHAMDEALDWLIVLANPTPAQCQAFDAWLARDPNHAAAYAKASVAWSQTVTRDATDALATPAWLSWPPHKLWSGLAVATLVVLGIALYGWVAAR